MIHIFEEMVRDSLTGDTLRMHPADVLIPVPIHRARRRKRGFNQAELIAELLSRILSIPVSSGNLLKTKNTIPQTGLTGKCRPINLKNSFSVLTPSTLVGKSIILVDDVRTTGATLDACAIELQNAGIKKISAFTLARTL
jgi:ComF family protein